MGWRFHKSIKILPGIKLNVGKKGISSISVGPRGAKLNVGKNGTRLTTGIPGSGLYYTTRLDKPVSKGMTECPFCGHHMRKQWDACPKCKTSLVKEVSKPQEEKDEPNIIDAEAHFIDDNKPIVKLNKQDSSQDKKQGCLGCFTIIIVLFLIGSCMFGGSDKQNSTPAPPATTASVQANMTKAPEQKQDISAAKTAAVAATSTQSSNDQKVETQPSEPPTQQAPTEKKYYGAGPHGEGIKGHINRSKGTRIYHLPGDPYYSRTTHVSQWFFTEKEAQSAGYRHIYR